MVLKQTGRFLFLLWLACITGMFSLFTVTYKIKADIAHPSPKALDLLWEDVFLDSPIFSHPIEATAYETMFPLILNHALPSFPVLLANLPFNELSRNSKILCDLWFNSTTSDLNTTFTNSSSATIIKHASNIIKTNGKFTPTPFAVNYTWLNSSCDSLIQIHKIISYLDNELGYLGRMEPFKHYTNDTKISQSQRDVLTSLVSTIMEMCCFQEVEQILPLLPPKSDLFNDTVTLFRRNIYRIHITNGQKLEQLNNSAKILSQTDLEIGKSLMDLLHFLDDQNQHLQLTVTHSLKITLAIVYTLQRAIYAQTLENSRLTCSQSKFPTTLITEPELLFKLNEFRNMLSNGGWTISEPAGGLKQLLQLPLTTCTFHKNSVEVVIQIPVIPTGPRGVVLSISNIPFRVYQAVCIQENEQTLIWQQRDRFYSLERNSLCQMGLCKIQDFGSQKLLNSPCMDAVLRDLTPEETNQVCRYVCTPAKLPLVHHLKPNLLTILSNEPLFIYTGNHPLPIHVKSYEVGFSKITLPCNSTIRNLHNKIISASYYPCTRTDKDPKVEPRVPSFLFKTARLQNKNHKPKLNGFYLNSDFDEFVLHQTRIHYKSISFSKKDRTEYQSTRNITRDEIAIWTHNNKIIHGAVFTILILIMIGMIWHGLAIRRQTLHNQTCQLYYQNTQLANRENSATVFEQIPLKPMQQKPSSSVLPLKHYEEKQTSAIPSHLELIEEGNELEHDYTPMFPLSEVSTILPGDQYPPPKGRQLPPIPSTSTQCQNKTSQNYQNPEGYQTPQGTKITGTANTNITKTNPISDPAIICRNELCCSIDNLYTPDKSPK
jgi:hypothetical protein